MAGANQNQFNQECHRLVDLSLHGVRELLDKGGAGVLKQALGYARLQEASRWGVHESHGFQVDLKVELLQGSWWNRWWPTKVWQTVKCTPGQWKDFYGLSVYTQHPKNWHLEYAPDRDCPDRDAALRQFLSGVDPHRPDCPAADEIVGKLGQHDVRRKVCFRTRTQLQATGLGAPIQPTRVPEKCALDWDADHMLPAATNLPSSGPAPTPPPRPKRKLIDGHGLIYPTGKINLSQAHIILPEGGAGYLYLNDPRGHWDEWEFCCIMQMKAVADERGEVGGDREGSVLLNALEAALDDPPSVEFKFSELDKARTSLLDYAEQHQPFLLGAFLAMQSLPELIQLENVVLASPETAQLDKETLERVLSELRTHQDATTKKTRVFGMYKYLWVDAPTRH